MKQGALAFFKKMVKQHFILIRNSKYKWKNKYNSTENVTDSARIREAREILVTKISREFSENIHLKFFKIIYIKSTYNKIFNNKLKPKFHTIKSTFKYYQTSQSSSRNYLILCFGLPFLKPALYKIWIPSLLSHYWV